MVGIFNFFSFFFSCAVEDTFLPGERIQKKSLLNTGHQRSPGISEKLGMSFSLLHLLPKVIPWPSITVPDRATGGNKWRVQFVSYHHSYGCFLGSSWLFKRFALKRLSQPQDSPLLPQRSLHSIENFPKEKHKCSFAPLVAAWPFLTLFPRSQLSAWFFGLKNRGPWSRSCGVGTDGEQCGWKGKLNAAFEDQWLERVSTGL